MGDQPTSETTLNDYPTMLARVDHTEPVPRRVRGYLGGRLVFDTQEALYVWEWPNYAQFYIPATDVEAGLIVDEQTVKRVRQEIERVHGLRVPQVTHTGCAMLFTDDSLKGSFRQGALRLGCPRLVVRGGREVFVHPRNPYTRVEALKSTRAVRIELDGTVLAESSSPVLVFETGLPTRYYLNRTEVTLDCLIPTDTVTSCPYKGRTSGYWSVQIGRTIHQDLAWAYDFPTRQLLPIAGLIAFYNEKVDVFREGRLRPRPVTHFFA